MTESTKEILSQEEVKSTLAKFDPPKNVIEDEGDKEKVKRAVVTKDGIVYILTVAAQGMYDHQSGDTHFAYVLHSLVVADESVNFDEA